MISISLIVAETALGQTVTLGRLLASGGGHESPLALFVATESCRYRVRVFATDVPFGIGPFVFWRFEKQIGADIDSVACPGDTVRTDDLGANHKYTWAWWTPCEAQEPTGDTYYVTGEINVP